VERGTRAEPVDEWESAQPRKGLFKERNVDLHADPVSHYLYRINAMDDHVHICRDYIRVSHWLIL